VLAVKRTLVDLLLLGVFLALLAPVYAQGQGAGVIPPDVRAIMNKLSSGQQPTPEEQKRLQEWATSQAGGQSHSAGAKLGSSAGGGAGEVAQRAKASLAQFCPSSAGVQLPVAPPSGAEYVALVKTLVSKYGAKLPLATRASLDAGLAKPGGGNGASVGAMLNAGGAMDESVYAAAVAAMRNPADALAANNLGVTLSEAGDHRSSSLVLLYLSRLRPNSPLAAVNLGWTYFNAGAVAPAQRAFQHALGLAPDMAGPEAGMGLIAACRGDTPTAMRLLKSSLGKGYSAVAAAALVRAQANQPPAQQGQGQSGTQETPSPPPDLSGESQEMIPDLPLYPQAERNLGQTEGLKRVRDWSKSRLGELESRLQELSARVAALNRRATQEGNALYLPVVFDRELFEFRQVMDLTFVARFRNMDATAQAVTQVQNTNAQVTAAAILPEQQHFFQLNERLIELMQEMAACGDNDLCRAQVEKKMNAVKAEMEDTAYQICLHSKQSMDVTYVQAYKLWKTQWDDFRPAAADLYVFTDPILQRVWVPSLNELLQTQREAAVMTVYHASAGEAAALAEMAQAYKDFKCVPPAPPATAENAEQPKLPQESPPECPLKPPVSLGCGLVSITLGCDSAAIEGGEGLRFKASRDFRKHETTLWAGVGASAAAKADFLGPLSPKAELKTETGVGVTFGQGGAVSGVFVSSTLSASASAGGRSIGMSASGTAALEGGATLSASLAGMDASVHN
jgi:tetratricopeptide (TPR) repeat protein